MNIIELQRSLRQLRLGGMAAVLEARLRQAQAEPMAPIDLVSCLISDELTRRADRLLERRRKQAVRAVADGEAGKTVAKVLGVTVRTVSRWVRASRTPDGTADCVVS